MGHQTSSGPIRLPRWPWHYHARIWPPVQPRLCHRASILCYVLLVHQPGPWPAGSLGKMEGRQRLQERGVLVTERGGCKGCTFAPTRTWRQSDHAFQRASRLHWCEGGGPFQRRYIPILSGSLTCVGIHARVFCIAVHSCPLMRLAYEPDLCQRQDHDVVTDAHPIQKTATK